PANPAKQEEAVQRKLKLINQLSLELANVIKYDSGDQVVASLTTLGEAYQHMVYAIESTPLPKDLNAKELQTYRQELSKVTDPFKKKAIENYQGAIDKARQINATSDWIFVAMRGLHSIDKSAPLPSENLETERMPDLM